MALLDVTETSANGGSVPFVAADPLGDEFANSGTVLLEVNNQGASEITVTIDSQTPCNYGFDHDVIVSVPAGEARVIGPFSRRRFNDTSGRVHVAYSDATSVTVRAMRLPD